jgi:hypothetical protein
MSYRLPLCYTFVIALAFAFVSDVGRSGAEETAPTLAPEPTVWAIRPLLPDPKKAENISGAACYQVNGAGNPACSLAMKENMRASLRLMTTRSSRGRPLPYYLEKNTTKR